MCRRKKKGGDLLEEINTSIKLSVLKNSTHPGFPFLFPVEYLFLCSPAGRFQFKWVFKKNPYKYNVCKRKPERHYCGLLEHISIVSFLGCVTVETLLRQGCLIEAETHIPAA